MEKSEFIESIKSRTKQLAIDLILWYDNVKKTDALRVIGRQLIRSSTSTASNYRAACVSRSKKEFISKISIVVEEADETLFWLEMLRDSKLSNDRILQNSIQEINEIVKIVSRARKSSMA